MMGDDGVVGRAASCRDASSITLVRGAAAGDEGSVALAPDLRAGRTQHLGQLFIEPRYAPYVLPALEGALLDQLSRALRSTPAKQRALVLYLLSYAPDPRAPLARPAPPPPLLREALAALP
jgi:hypothetical protein